LTERAGEPEIVGATFVGVVEPRTVAVIEKAGSVVTLTPSLTRIWMLLHEPADLG
jgi:hypothetical protein